MMRGTVNWVLFKKFEDPCLTPCPPKIFPYHTHTHTFSLILFFFLCLSHTYPWQLLSKYLLIQEPTKDQLSFLRKFSEKNRCVTFVLCCLTKNFFFLKSQKVWKGTGTQWVPSLSSLSSPRTQMMKYLLGDQTCSSAQMAALTWVTLQESRPVSVSLQLALEPWRGTCYQPLRKGNRTPKKEVRLQRAKDTEAKCILSFWPPSGNQEQYPFFLLPTLSILTIHSILSCVAAYRQPCRLEK